MVTATLHQKMTLGWAIRWRTADWEALLGKFYDGPDKYDIPDCVDGYTVMVFSSRKKAREFVKRHFGYIKDRPDLKGPPHNWKTPKVVKVMVTVQEVPCK